MARRVRAVKTVRHLALIVFFLGLAALEIAHGIFRLNTLREGHRGKLLEGIEREHEDLVRALRTRLAQEREHASYLARTPVVAELLTAPPPAAEARRRLESLLLPYLVSFRGIDRVRVLDAEGRERFRCERMGQGVGALPEALLEREPDVAMLRLAQSLGPGDVALSSLDFDQERVEVPESDRQVIQYLANIQSGGSRVGVLVLTAYASGILNAVRQFAPLAGVSALLVDGEGRYLANADRSREAGNRAAGDLQRDFSGAADAILAGSPEAAGPSFVLRSQPVSEAPSWRLVAVVPETALEAASGHLRGEYAWVIGSMLAITLVLAAAGAFFVRLSARELRLREAERHKELERQLQTSERLGSLGLLTAGVAHEINNPLEGIGNYLALLERDGLAEEKRKRYIELIRYGFQRIRDIVRDLSAFARPGVSGGEADLAAVAAGALKMAAYSKELKEVEVELAGLDEPVVVPGDARRLEQVFINLLLNAGRAMGGKGSVRIESRRATAESGAPLVEVTVDDTGPGVPPAILDKIFDPFFTTSDGTGLGLSISYGIVRAHGGSISAQNRPEGGARFTVRLPAAMREVASTLRAAPSGGPRRARMAK
jgi:signal transduction histidine kinase